MKSLASASVRHHLRQVAASHGDRAVAAAATTEHPSRLSEMLVLSKVSGAVLERFLSRLPGGCPILEVLQSFKGNTLATKEILTAFFRAALRGRAYDPEAAALVAASFRHPRLPEALSLWQADPTWAFARLRDAAGSPRRFAEVVGNLIAMAAA